MKRFSAGSRCRGQHLLLMVAIGSALLGACAADLPETADTRGGDVLSWNDDVELSSLEIAVGSKSTVEQQVLGHLAIEALAASGADVVDQVDLGTTLEVRDAQLGGLIDLYWEYTGTGWLELLREIGPSSDPEELAEAVTETDLDENDIAWLMPAPADSTFALIASSAVADELEVTALSGLGPVLEEDDRAVICVPEGGTFEREPAGLPALLSALEIPETDDQVVEVPAAELVEAVEAGAFCPFGQVRRTSPQMVGADVQVLDDDVGAFVPRNPTVTVRAEVLAEFPELADVLDPVATALTDDVLQMLTAAVTIDGAEPRAVARQWLVDEGLADR